MHRQSPRTLLQLSTVCCVALTFAANSRAALYNGDSGICAPQPQSFVVGSRATCTFTKVVDIDSHRIPPAIPSVRCKCPGSRCSSRGDFRCVEVKDSLQVSYRSSKSPTELVNKTIDVTTSCVCAMSQSMTAKSTGVLRTESGPIGENDLDSWR